jgi:hypothetical protein
VVGVAGGVEEGVVVVVVWGVVGVGVVCQRFWYNNETTIDLPGVHQSIQDERGLDGFAEADFVGEQPAHRIAGTRALGDIQLVREQADAAAEKRAQTVCFAKRQEVEDVQTDGEVLEIIDIAQRKSIEERAFEFERPQRVRRSRSSIRQPQGPVSEPRSDGRLLAGFDDANGTSAAQIDRDQRVGAGGEPQCLA